MKNQVGARYLARERAKLAKDDVVCTSHVKRESDLTRVKPGVVRRKRDLNSITVTAFVKANDLVK